MKKEIINKYLSTVITSYKSMDYDNIVNIYDALVTTANTGGNIYICGNGGSASTASHFQNDLNNSFSITLKLMPAICLVDNISTITATSNDLCYEDVFKHQLKYILKKNDLLITISGSGNSVNIIKAAEYARSQGNIVISLVGFDGGKLKKISNYCFHVNVNNMQISEDLHLLFCHLVSTLIRECENIQHDKS